MKTLLRIDSSFNLNGSFSRLAADHFETLWKEQNPEANVLYRDLEKSALPHLSQSTYAAFGQSGDTESVQMSDELIEELEQADTILLSSPVYNFSVPSTLKAYIDHVIRINRTFGYDPVNQTRKGLLTEKTAAVIVARGGLPIEGKSPDGVEDYLTGILKFMGIDQVDTFSVYGTTNENADKQLQDTKNKISEFHKNLV